MCPHVITIMALWQLLHLGHRMYAYTLFGRIAYSEVTRVLKLRPVNHA